MSLKIFFEKAVKVLLILVALATVAPAPAPANALDIKTLEKRAGEGNADAMYLLARRYQQGRETDRDMDKALALYNRAAEKGHAEALYTLALMYKKGNWVKKDNKIAQSLFFAAAKKGHAKAQFKMGWRQIRPGGDLAKARHWFNQAADQGLVEGQYYLARMLEYGQGGAEDPALAKTWYEKAARRGHADAHWSLALLHYKGKLGTKDLIRVYMHMKLAAHFGQTRGKLEAKAAAREMNSQQIKKAEKMIKAWLKKYGDG